MANDVIIRGKDRLQEISMKLEQSHLVYLQTDDSPLKLQQRHKLEGFIKEYLCLVPNENKYVFQETADILHRSAATVTDFSGYRAATAWSAISLYAANLLAQPWRKEYRTVRTYSGYYKHEMEANLIGAELMFEQMGYKHTGLGVLTLEGPIDPDKVSSVSRDAIVAFVECQILKQIWESVSQNYTISWLEVLEFRESHVGTPEQAIRALNYRYLEKIHQNRAKLADTYKDYYTQQIAADALPLHLSYHHMHNYNTTMPAICQTDYRHIEDATVNLSALPTNYRYCQPVEHGLVNCCNSYGCLSTHGNKYYGGGVVSPPNPYCTTLPAYAARVPTARLIELDVPTSVANYDKVTHANRKPTSQRISDLDEIDFYRQQTSDGEHEYNRTDRKTAARPNFSIGGGGGGGGSGSGGGGGGRKDGYDTWDFVYRNLESQGYYKDLDDRDDVLQRKEFDAARVSRHNKTHHRQAENEDKYNAHKRRNGSGRNETVEIELIGTNGSRNHQDVLSFKKKSSSFDLSDSNRHSTTDAYNRDKKHNSQTLPISRTHKSSDQIAKIANSFQNLDVAHTDKEKKEKEGEEQEQGEEVEKPREEKRKWNCATCTYLNIPGRDICEMCAKSRSKGNEDKPLASGGKECPKCTLVNEKNVSSCDACQTSLKDSPTYI